MQAADEKNRLWRQCARVHDVRGPRPPTPQSGEYTSVVEKFRAVYRAFSAISDDFEHDFEQFRAQLIE